jgi:hypothetical protein
VYSSYGRDCSSEFVQAVDRFITPTPLRNPHPTGSAKGCHGTARDILVGHNTVPAPRQYGGILIQFFNKKIKKKSREKTRFAKGKKKMSSIRTMHPPAEVFWQWEN